MRRFLFVLLAAGVTLPAARAQASFGFQAGINVADLQVSDDEPAPEGFDEQSRLGLLVGVVADVPLSPSLSFHPELNYSQKGERYVVDAAGVEGSVTTRIDYVEVPLLLRYAMPVGQNGLTIGLEGGPTLAYKINAGFSCSGAFEDTECTDDGELDEDTTDFDLGAALGVTVGAGPYSVGLRYTQGITSINDSADDTDETTVRNRVFSVFGRFMLGR